MEYVPPVKTPEWFCGFDNATGGGVYKVASSKWVKSILGELSSFISFRDDKIKKMYIPISSHVSQLISQLSLQTHHLLPPLFGVRVPLYFPFTSLYRLYLFHYSWHECQS